MSTAIRVENLGKKYVLRHQVGHRSGYVSLREVLSEKCKSIFTKRSDLEPVPGWEDFWALKDLSFEVQKGEAVGIIGRNGAGKSTLLKLLSRITKPTTGCIQIDGRVASLLEVGTGFHPELTGRENVYLNGAILGMHRREIKAKFDEIVAFADVEKFLDTPVKRYSSGMYMRLAFAVSAHLEPEILVVDEVLAVGDVEFQKKCLNKMQDASKNEGRTVLFVSHNLSAVRNLCTSGILLDKGKIRTTGDINTVLNAYSNNAEQSDEVLYSPTPNKPSITRIAIDRQGLERGDIIVDISYELPHTLAMLVPGAGISSIGGTPVFGSNPVFHQQGYSSPTQLRGTIRMESIQPPLFSASYNLSIWLSDFHQTYDVKYDALTFEFKPHQLPLNLPNLETMGYLDSQTKWRSLTSE